jgi:hypothetical protein
MKTTIEYGKWYIDILKYTNVKKRKHVRYLDVPIAFSIGIGNLRDRLCGGFWFHLSLFNKGISEGERFKGLHISIPLWKTPFNKLT